MTLTATNVMLSPTLGGLEQSAVYWHLALRSQGYSCTTVCHPLGIVPAQLEAQEIAFLRSFGKWDYLSSFRLRRLCDNSAVALLHGNRAIGLAVRQRGWKAKRVGIVHNFRFKSDIARLDGVICVSTGVATAVGEKFPALPCEVVPNLVLLPDGVVQTVPSKQFRIGALGRLHVNKGFDVLIESCRLLAASGLELRLEIAGDGPEMKNLVNRVDTAGLADRTRFWGWVSDKKAFFEQIDVLVVSSRVEPFGMIVTEAQAHGVPVIATDTTGPLEILTEGEDGLIVPRENSPALASALQRLVGDVGLRDRLRARGLITAKRYSFDEIKRVADTAVRRLAAAGE